MFNQSLINKRNAITCTLAQYLILSKQVAVFSIINLEENLKMTLVRGLREKKNKTKQKPSVLKNPLSNVHDTTRVLSDNISPYNRKKVKLSSPLHSWTSIPFPEVSHHFHSSKFLGKH